MANQDYQSQISKNQEKYQYLVGLKRCEKEAINDDLSLKSIIENFKKPYNKEDLSDYLLEFDNPSLLAKEVNKLENYIQAYIESKFSDLA